MKKGIHFGGDLILKIIILGDCGIYYPPCTTETVEF
jgi:hypothetical protein